MKFEEIKLKVEIPKGNSNKYEMNQHTGELELDRVLYGSIYYPEEYCFIPETIDFDGDPLDALCLVTYATFPGCWIKSRIIGVLRMIDQGIEDYKIIAVNNYDPYLKEIINIDDLKEAKRNEIENFFLSYKNLEKKKVEIYGYGGREEAISIIKKCSLLYKKCKDLISKKTNKKNIIKFLEKMKKCET